MSTTKYAIPAYNLRRENLNSMSLEELRLEVSSIFFDLEFSNDLFEFVTEAVGKYKGPEIKSQILVEFICWINGSQMSITQEKVYNWKWETHFSEFLRSLINPDPSKYLIGDTTLFDYRKIKIHCHKDLEERHLSAHLRSHPGVQEDILFGLAETDKFFKLFSPGVIVDEHGEIVNPKFAHCSMCKDLGLTKLVYKMDYPTKLNGVQEYLCKGHFLSMKPKMQKNLADAFDLSVQWALERGIQNHIHSFRNCDICDAQNVDHFLGKEHNPPLQDSNGQILRTTEEPLQLDHRNIFCKTNSVYKLAMWGHSKEELAEEMLKCRFLCDSCHSRKSDMESKLRLYKIKRTFTNLKNRIMRLNPYLKFTPAERIADLELDHVEHLDMDFQLFRDNEDYMKDLEDWCDQHYQKLAEIFGPHQELMYENMKRLIQIEKGIVSANQVTDLIAQQGVIRNVRIQFTMFNPLDVMSRELERLRAVYLHKIKSSSNTTEKKADDSFSEECVEEADTEEMKDEDSTSTDGNMNIHRKILEFKKWKQDSNIPKEFCRICGCFGQVYGFLEMLNDGTVVPLVRGETTFPNIRVGNDIVDPDTFGKFVSCKNCYRNITQDVIPDNTSVEERQKWFSGIFKVFGRSVTSLTKQISHDVRSELVQALDVKAQFDILESAQKNIKEKDWNIAQRLKDALVRLVRRSGKKYLETTVYNFLDASKRTNNKFKSEVVTEIVGTRLPNNVCRLRHTIPADMQQVLGGEVLIPALFELWQRIFPEDMGEIHNLRCCPGCWKLLQYSLESISVLEQKAEVEEEKLALMVFSQKALIRLMKTAGDSFQEHYCPLESPLLKEGDLNDRNKALNVFRTEKLDRTDPNVLREAWAANEAPSFDLSEQQMAPFLRAVWQAENQRRRREEGETNSAKRQKMEN